ncbi:amidohydrolase [Bosea caraganae]|uniref:Amidohydrolase n=1 Tax=Bosea caraganae TaxID=2763117 RepID=A0A370LCG0_9HYPH|nr:amidohydrolase [Bosea caraganae]RDJ27649.1 amidohydrolase [Bosea caraganae]RDJ29663.1 amidohydrolase [Bosea caraganae]
MTTTRLDGWLDQHHADFTAIRRDIHAHPELGLEEQRTSALVAAKLRAWGIEVTEGVGGTGVVGVIRGKRPGQRAVGLRADMDALALIEETGLPYASQNPGRMHACGHDGHTTMLLGAARYLAENPDFGGTLNLIFQPAEEGRGGAVAMLDDGLFERFPCDAIYGLHNSPGMAAGTFGTCNGPMLAAADSWQVIFRGVGGHGGSQAHLSTDITYAQAHFVLGLQGIVGRNVPSLDTAVISVGYIHAGSAEASNVVPSELAIGGTARSYAPEIRDLIERRIAELAAATAQAWGCTAEATYHRGPSALLNQAEQVEVAIAAASASVGAQNVNGKIRPGTGGEDFAEMMKIKPGAFMRIGNGVKADGSFNGLHTPLFDFNDAIIPDGIRYWVNIVNEELGEDKRALAA